MFDWLVFVGALLLAAPVIAIVALVRSIGLNSRLRSLEAKIATLERQFPATDTSRVQTTARTAATPLQTEPQAPQPVPPVTPARQVASPVEATPAATSVPTFPRSDSAATTKKIGFEERFGTRWVVWVGGIALALGGIFLVRYSIEQGLVGPGVRIMLGGLLAAALIDAGEWQRRTERQLSFPGARSANIPSVLTAAGTTVAYATIYAAYALYGFLPPAAAFVLLGAVALATLAAALLHGPALGGLGIIGAYLAPILVASTEPDYWSLYIYLAVVNAAAFLLARIRLWYWLALTALVLGALWSWPGTDPIYFSFVAALGAHVFYVVASFALAATFLVANLLYGPTAAPAAMDRLSNFALSIYLLAATILVLTSRHDPVALVPFIVLTAVTVAIAWRTAAATAAVPAAAILAAAVMAHWAVHERLDALIAPPGVTAPAIPGPEYFDYGSHFATAAFWAALFGIAGFLAQGRAARALVPMLWSATAVFAPLAMLIALYYRIAELDRSLPFAGLALLLSAIYGAATEALVQREKRPGLMAGSAVFATGSLAALALALTFALEKGWLTIALALMAPGAAWVAGQRPIPWLRWLAAAIAAIVVARIAYEPRIVGAEVGTTPIFNWLLYGYGVPAASFWLGGWLLRQRADDLPARIVDAAAILFSVLLVTWEIRHYVTGGEIYGPLRSDVEIMLYANAGLAMTIGLERVRARTQNVIHNLGALVVATLAFIAVLADLIAAPDLQFSNTPLGGGIFFNIILLGYGLPATLAIALALIARTTRPMPYRAIAAITAVILAMFYLTLEVRRIFHGPELAGVTSDAEQYTYSTVWLIFAIALLAIGFMLRSQPARFLALGVIAMTIAKVFLFDTANIAGIYRALSVTGLGVVLLGIGWLYQRVLYPQAAAPADGT
jgi:uncharacterized membrane protein